MADIHWTNGTADNLWATAGNWDGGVPAATDNVFIGGRSSDSISGAVVTVTPARVTFRNYRGSFGEAGNPVIFEAALAHDLDYLELQGSGQFYINTDADVTIVVAVAAISQRDPAKCVLQGAAWTSLYALMGNMTISATIANVYQEFISNPRSNTMMVVTASAAITNFRQLGGRSTHSKTITGDVRLDTGAHMTMNIGNIDGIAYLHGGSRLVYNSAGGDIDDIEIFPKSVLDFTQSQDARSISGSTCIVHAGGLIDATGISELITIVPDIILIGANARAIPASLGTQVSFQSGVQVG